MDSRRRVTHQEGRDAGPACPYRQPTYDPRQFYCRHRLVHAADHRVTPEVCRLCTARQVECTDPRPLPASEDLLPEGLRTRDPREMSRARLLLGAPAPLPGVDSVTIGITAFQRPASLRRLLKSLGRYYPGVRTVVIDTGDEPLGNVPTGIRYERRTDLFGNLSAARNVLVQMAETEFVWILEDDFQLADSSALTAVLDVLASDPNVGVVGGRLFEDGEPTDYAGDLRQFRDVLEITQPPHSRWLATARGTRYRYCDMVFNFFLARREVLRKLPWDEDLPLHEHAVWFLELRHQATWGVAFTPASAAIHHRDRPTEDYRNARGRTKKLRIVLKEKYGFADVRHVDFQHRDRSNVVVLGVGHDNTSITIKQLFRLSWNAGDADEEYGESVSIREINRRLIRTGELSVRDAYDALRQLPEPWAIKDPRFSVTLDRWLPLLVDYEPMLLWLRKNMDVVWASYGKREELTGRKDILCKRFENCRRFYEAWPWTKLTISAEEIAEAVSIFDLSRMQLGRCDHGLTSGQRSHPS